MSVGAHPRSSPHLDAASHLGTAFFLLIPVEIFCLYTTRIGKLNGIFVRCLWERTPGAPPTWTPHHILVPLFSSSSLLKYFACILLICAVQSSIFPVTSIPSILSGGCSHGASCCHL